MQVSGLVTIAPASIDTAASKPSLIGMLGAEAAAIMRAIRHANDNRRSRQRLAELSDALLIDIGIASDEIHRIRMQEKFTPREWLIRQPGLR